MSKNIYFTITKSQINRKPKLERWLTQQSAYHQAREPEFRYPTLMPKTGIGATCNPSAETTMILISEFSGHPFYLFFLSL